MFGKKTTFLSVWPIRRFLLFSKFVSLISKETLFEYFTLHNHGTWELHNVLYKCEFHFVFSHCSICSLNHKNLERKPVLSFIGRPFYQGASILWVFDWDRTMYQPISSEQKWPKYDSGQKILLEFHAKSLYSILWYASSVKVLTDLRYALRQIWTISQIISTRSVCTLCIVKVLSVFKL